MTSTSIEWTATYHPDGTVSAGHTVNPIRARLRDAAHAGLTKGGYGSGVGHFCEKIGPDCALCYASTSQKRFGMPAFPGVQKVAPVADQLGLGSVPVNDEVEVFFDADRLEEVLRRKKPTKYFWCDQTDLFGRWVPDDWIERCFAVMALTPWHTHQVLTKRSDRMAEYLTQIVKGRLTKWGRHAGTSLPDIERAHERIWQLAAKGNPSYRLPGWPLPNVWLGTSVGNQKTADERIPHLLRCPAAVRFLSCEPLLGPVDLDRDLGGTLWIGGQRGCGATHIGDGTPGCPQAPHHHHDNRCRPGIDWVIVGGESGPGARRFDVEWARSLIRQCKAADVACFVKQLGAKPYDSKHRISIDGPDSHAVELLMDDKKGGDPDEWPEELRVRQFPEVVHA